MSQDEAYHCLLKVLNNLVDKGDANCILDVFYKTDIDYVLKAASPETVYGALHAWARGKDNG